LCLYASVSMKNAASIFRVEFICGIWHVNLSNVMTSIKSLSQSAVFVCGYSYVTRRTSIPVSCSWLWAIFHNIKHTKGSCAHAYRRASVCLS
jgi:hypothetical protein